EDGARVVRKETLDIQVAGEQFRAHIHRHVGSEVAAVLVMLALQQTPYLQDVSVESRRSDDDVVRERVDLVHSSVDDDRLVHGHSRVRCDDD
ncbi:hypothetical protein PMAYCL1PPCAC_14276, partial [Pristionchus mayeri]